MADGYLEKRQRDYEARKAEYLRRNGGQLGRKRHQPVSPQRNVERPDDESL